MVQREIREAAWADSYDDEKNPAAGVVTQATWKGKIWDTFDLPPRERKLLFKVDAFILIFASVSAAARIVWRSAQISSATSSRTSTSRM